MPTQELRKRPIVLIVRDGWGSNPFPEWNHANAVYLAKKPIDDHLMATYPHVLIKTSGNDVGLPGGVMGNSEVGHQNIGAGRIVEQEIMRITGRIKDGTFFKNPALLEAFSRVTSTNGNVHILGLCSDGRVHSDLDHLFGLLDMSKRLKFPGDRIFIHAITDGRDTAPNSGLGFIDQIDEKCEKLYINPIASVVGRYYAMDRDNRWDRVEKAYAMLTGQGDCCSIPTYSSADAPIQNYYDNPTSETMKGDEFITPSITCTPEFDSRIRDGDSVIFFNYRGDRPREITKAFVYDEFPYDGVDKDGTKKRFGFDRGKKLDLYFVTMTGYETGLPVNVAFEKPPKMANILGGYAASLGLRQFRCAETEKYPHVTFFFNDYRDEPFEGEERFLVPSPRDVATYDQKPQMSAYEVTQAVLDRLATGVDDLLVINFANGDMVGHTGNLQAAIKAVETVDECVGKIVHAVQERKGALIITADHGNCEQMIDPATGGPHTAHTTYDVELIVVDDAMKKKTLRKDGRLADIAPTLLELAGIPIPPDMTGQSLFPKKQDASV